MSHRHAPSGWRAFWLRPFARLTGWALAAGALGLSALPAAQAQTSFPTPPPQSRVFISQGASTSDPIQLYDIKQIADTFDFTTLLGSPATVRYNAIGYHPSDGYLYGIRSDSTAANTNHLVQIDSAGAAFDLGAITGLPTNGTQNINSGTFGANTYADTLFVRRGNPTANTSMWAVDITTKTATAITLSQTMPNTADLVWSQGFLWSVYGDGTTVTMYRIDPGTGAVTTYSLPVDTTLSIAGIISETYGAQWAYGNTGSTGNSGIIGISSNSTANPPQPPRAAYQILIANGASATPTFTILAALDTTPTTQNDAASIIGPPVDMGIAKAVTVPVCSSGTCTADYTFTVTNESAVGITSSGSIVSDLLPFGMSVVNSSLPANCRTAPAVDASNNPVTRLSCSVDSLAGGTSAPPITVTVQFSASAGSLVNTATIIGNESDPNPDNDTSTVTTSPTQPVLSITKTASTTAALIPSTTGAVTYTVTVKNTGAADAVNAKVTDPLPAGIASVAWSRSCAPTDCPASNTGALSDTLTIPSGATVTYQIIATTGSSLPASVTNTAKVTLLTPTDGVCLDGSALPCTSSVSNPSVPAVSITKTADAQTTPGGQVIYTVTVDNTGSLDASGTVVQDPLPTNIDSVTWTCTASGGAACPGTGSGSAALNQTLATFPAGSNVVYKITAKVNASVVVGTTLKNTATVTPPTGGVCGQSGCSQEADTAVVGPILGITKTASTTAALAASTTGAVTYTVTVKNTGVIDAANAQVTDPLPAGIASFKWSRTCTPATACAAVSDITNSTAVINDTLTIAAGATVTYQIIATTGASLPATVTNTAKVTLPTPASGVCANGTALPCTASVANPVEPVMSITKSVDQSTTSDGKATYTITAANTGTVPSPGTTVADPLFVTGVTYQWTCTGAGGAVCPSDSGSGAINDTLDFPVGGSVTYVVEATLPANVPRTRLNNVATVTTQGGGSTCGSACESSANAFVTVLAPFGVDAAAAPIPALDARALALLAALLAGLAAFHRRKTRA